MNDTKFYMSEKLQNTGQTTGEEPIAIFCSQRSIRMIILSESENMSEKTADNSNVNSAKGETNMTDYQFRTYVELRDKYDAVLLELEQLRQKAPQTVDDGMTDYQFRRYEKLRDKYEELKVELAMQREVNVKLQIQVEMMRTLTNEKKYNS